MKRLRNLFKQSIVVFAISALTLPLVATIPAMADSGDSGGGSCYGRFLTLPAWHRGVVYRVGNDCEVKTIAEPERDSQGNITKDIDHDREITLTSFVWTVVLNIIEMALHAIGYIATFFIIYGGFQFFTANGSPEGVTKARKTITNAVIGLIISLVSVGIVNLIMGIIG
jgi:hypothetical protein